MVDFFAAIFEWFGFIPFYSTDLGNHLRGWDITCTDYIATPWYVNIGWILVVITALIYVLLYHIIDSSKLNKKGHWWIFALILTVIVFLISFSIPFNDLQTDNYCNQLEINVGDCIGFGFSSALWSLILFIIISTPPLLRNLSINCRHTTFWKP